MVGAARGVHVHVGPADVERGDLGRLGALDQGRTRDDHVGLLGHVDHVADDRHVPATGDAVPVDARDLRNAGVGEQGVHAEDRSGARAPREGVGLLGQVQAGAVHEVDHGQAQAQGDLLRALDLLRRLRPPRAGGHGVVVGDGHDPAAVHAHERGDDAGARGATALGTEAASVVDQRAHGQDRRARIGEAFHALPRRGLALVVHARAIALAPAVAHDVTLPAQRLDEPVHLLALPACRLAAYDLLERPADRLQDHLGHGASASLMRPARAGRCGQENRCRSFPSGTPRCAARRGAAAPSCARPR